MTPARGARPVLEKELRALLPTFLATALAVAAGGLLQIRATAVVLAIFCWGVVTLGAHSIGHEYSHRTLPLLLAQPRGRARMLAHKAIVLIPLVLVLTLLTTLSLPGDALDPLQRPGGPRTLLILAALSAISVAPLLSMVARGTLAATVFTLAVGGVLTLIGEWVGTARYGFRAANSVATFKLTFVQASATWICAVAAIAVWWRFQRLQAVEGQQTVDLPAWLRRRSPETALRPVRVGHAGRALLRKELHLQQISFLVVGLYVMVWLALWLTADGPPDTLRVALQPLTLMYLGLLSLLIGSVASAEERQLGTLPSQLLLPIAAWKQWTIKAGTAVGLAVVLGIVLPLLLHAVLPLPDDRLPPRLTREPLVAVVLLTMLSMYVSSLSASGVRAMVPSIALVMVTSMYAGAMASVIGRIAYRSIFQTPGGSDLRRAAVKALQTRTEYAMVLTVILISVLLLRFAFVNHCSDERRPSRTIAQAIVLFAVLTICLMSPLLSWP